MQPSANSGSVEAVIRELIERHFFTQTEQYLALAPWLNKRREYKSCGRIFGSRGAGKTRALQEYNASANGHRGPMRRIKPLRSFYLKSFTSWGTQDVCGRILELLNHGAKKGNPEISVANLGNAGRFWARTFNLDNAHFVTDKVLFDLVECYRDFRIATVLVGSDQELDARLKALGLFNNFRCHYEFQALSPRQVVAS
jgi:hypothetical protein